MPTITRWYVKTSLISLLLGISLGAVQLYPKINLPGAYPIFIHLLTFGWLTQLIFGIAIWMFPTFSKEMPRGPEWIGWIIYASLNSGLILRIIFEPLLIIRPENLTSWAIKFLKYFDANPLILKILFSNDVIQWALFASAVLQWLAGVLFVIAIWSRTRGTKPR